MAVQEDKRLKWRIRASYAISTVSIAMVLFLLGATTYLIFNALRATERLRESVAVHVMLKDDLTGEQIEKIGQLLENQEVVRTVTFVPKAEAAEKFIAESGEDFRTFLGDDPAANPLPDSFEVGLAAKGTNREVIESYVAEAEAISGVDEVVYQRNVVEQISANLGKFNIVLSLFGSALLVISLILLHNTVRMTIIAKRRIINTMRLVGANENFIMRQFLGTAFMHGFWAGLLSTAMFATLVYGLRQGVPELNFLDGIGLVASIALGMIVLGVAISLMFTTLAVYRAMREEYSKALI